MPEPLLFAEHRSALISLDEGSDALLLGLVTHAERSAHFFGLTVPAPILSFQKNSEEVFWLQPPEAKSGHEQNWGIQHAVFEDTLCRVHCQYTGDWGFGVAHLIQQPAGFEAAVSHVYDQILNLCAQIELPHFVKTWNYIEGINESENGIERYKLFNSGRRQAFLAADYPIGGGVSAACALGAEKGNLSVAFIISKQKALNLENPRQLSAYSYPQEYGMARPLFARATLLLQHTSANILFISGTASIVGHASLHPNQVEHQTEELLRNVRSILTQANGATPHKPWTLAKLLCRVYVRRSADVPKVQAIMQANGIQTACYVKADICRKELLVELEATGIDASSNHEHTAKP